MRRAFDYAGPLSRRLQFELGLPLALRRLLRRLDRKLLLLSKRVDVQPACQQLCCTAAASTQPRLTTSSIRAQEYRTMAGIVQVEQDEASVGRALCDILKLEAAIGVAAKDKFTFAISGGSMLGMLSHLADDDSTDWSKCVMGFVSHRCVPNDDDGATFHKARPKFLQSWMDRGLTVLTLGGSTDAEAEAAAYEAALG